jgi:hypothetical protein
MPIYLRDLDVLPETAGLNSALIVPCNMCPAVTVAVREQKPFIKLFSNFLKSVPFEEHVKALQSKLRDQGVATKVFKSPLYHQWFLCMWTSGRRKKLQKYAQQYDAVIVLGCDSAVATVRDLLESTDCKVIRGMEIAGIMNAKPSFKLPCTISFEDAKVVPISDSGESSQSRSS